MVDVYLDEKFIGTVSDKNSFLDEFKSKRRRGDLPESINLNYNEEFNEIFIDSKKGEEEDHYSFSYNQIKNKVKPRLRQKDPYSNKHLNSKKEYLVIHNIRHKLEEIKDLSKNV